MAGKRKPPVTVDEYLAAQEVIYRYSMQNKVLVGFADQIKPFPDSVRLEANTLLETMMREVRGSMIATLHKASFIPDRQFYKTDRQVMMLAFCRSLEELAAITEDVLEGDILATNLIDDFFGDEPTHQAH